MSNIVMFDEYTLNEKLPNNGEEVLVLLTQSAYDWNYEHSDQTTRKWVQCCFFKYSDIEVSIVTKSGRIYRKADVERWARTELIECCAK